MMEAMRSLLDPKAVAVVGASQRRGRGTNVVANLRDCGFAGEIFAVNPRYQDVLGYKCFPSVSDLPASVDCLVVAVAADAACDILEEAHARGIPAAIVLAAGFGEGGHGHARAARLRSLADQGMCICGPNCFGLISVKAGFAAYSGPLARPLRAGPVAIVSQSGGLGANVFAPLMTDRALGFSHFVSCGNQIGATVEDYIEYFIDDPDITVVAAVVEELKNPQKLIGLAAKANARRKSLVLFQAGRSAAGRIMVQSHTGALAGNAEILAAFLRRCGIVQVERYDEFVETVELFAIAPRDETVGSELVVISGSGGGAAIAADALHDAGAALASLHPTTKERIASVLPEFGSITNPIDGTGAIYDDPELLPKIVDAILTDPARPVIAASVAAKPAGNETMRRFARTFADAARASGRTVVAYQYTPLGGPLNSEIVKTLHDAQVPLLLGISNAMGALKHLPLRRDYWMRAAATTEASEQPGEPLGVRPRRRPVAVGLPDRATGFGRERRAGGRCRPRAFRGRSRRPAAPVQHRGRRQGRGPGPAAQERSRLRAPGLHGRAGGPRRLCGGRAKCAQRRFRGRRADPADDQGRRGGLCRHHRRSAVRSRHLLRPRGRIRRNPG